MSTTAPPSNVDPTAHLASCIQSACLLEATARKPGNVHPEAAFTDLTYGHFVQAASAIAPILARASEFGVGRAVLKAIEATRDIAPSNPNLGIVLLIAPLAAVPIEQTLSGGIAHVLDNLTIDDAEFVYEAIRLARPGGLGRVADQDVHSRPTLTLREVMQLAADRDRIAYQYAHNFADILEIGVRSLTQTADFSRDWEPAIIRLQLELLAHIPDSLIARKCGPEVAAEASCRARRLLEAGRNLLPGQSRDVAEFDEWLRADGNRRNPGTTADLVAATLFAAFRDRRVRIGDWKLEI